MLPFPHQLVATSHPQSNLADVKLKFTQLEDSIKIDVDVLKSFCNTMDHYMYHIHVLPVKDGDCNSTLGHYDPFNTNPNGNSTTYNCIAETPPTCEIGDLSGKFGMLGAFKERHTFYDKSDYKVQDIIGRSIVIHKSDKGRIACADIVKKEYTFDKFGKFWFKI